MTKLNISVGLNNDQFCGGSDHYDMICIIVPWLCNQLVKNQHFIDDSIIVVENSKVITAADTPLIDDNGNAVGTIEVSRD